MERLADGAGLVTLAIGAALAVVPVRAAATLGLGADAADARRIGVLDLGLGSAMLVGRPRWLWMAARAAFNVVLARRYLAEGRRPDGNPRAMGGAVAMSALTVVDGGIAAALLTRAGHSSGRA